MGGPVQIDKKQIIDMLRNQGDDQKADHAQEELPQQVDPEQHAGLLEKLGIDPQALLKQFMGGGGLPGF